MRLRFNFTTLFYERSTSWEIVVIGDSFVELGHLPYKDLFTTHIGKLLNIKVKNLGVSHTGPLTHCFYLKQYGYSPNTRHAILIFFEGNDIKDLLYEAQQVQKFRLTRKRDYRNLERQTSFLKAIYRSLYGIVRVELFQGRKYYPNAYFISRNGKVAVSVVFTPPSRNQLTSEQIALLDTTLFKWSETAKSLGMMPWLVYMPSKRRVLDSHLKFMESAKQEVIDWRPTDLPEFVSNLSKKNGMNFIDVTPELIRETENGSLTYNPVWDTHLNYKGSFIVGRVIAGELRLH
jgi:hypothetical protein